MELTQKDLQQIQAALDNLKCVLADTNEIVRKIHLIVENVEEREARAINDMLRVDKYDRADHR